jgi:hypothetical protein
MERFKQVLKDIAKLRTRIDKMKSGHLAVHAGAEDVTPSATVEDEATLRLLIEIVDGFYADLKVYAGDLIIDEGKRPEDLNASNDD